MKRLALIVVLLTTCVSFATTWHVEQATGDDTAAAADLSGKTAFKSIRKALANGKLKDGDTVLVGDGVYTAAEESTTSNVNGRTYLNITKGITLKSVNGPAKTHIVGRQSDETPEGFGANAARCITLNVKSDVADDIIIQGFTVRGGGTIDQKLTMGRGGAIYNAVTAKKNIFIVNCVISNCVSYSYVMNSPNLRGCRVEDCSVRTGAVIDKGTAAFTLFAGMRNATDVYVAGGIKAVNCTFVANRGSYDFIESESYVNHIHNSICSASGDVKLDKSATGPMDATNSLIGTSNAYPLMAPYFGDYRVRAGSAAEGTGNAEWLDEITLPTGWTFSDFTDPYGNPIDVNNLHLGAVQEAVTPAGGGLRLASSVTLEDGPALPHFSYVFPTNYPVQYKMGASLAAGKQLFGFSLSPVKTAPYRFPKWGENHIYTMPSPDPTKVTTNKIVLVDETIWVSPGEPGTGDGTYENPYGTLNDAIDHASQSSTSYLICAKGGVYNNGAKVLSDSAGANFGKAVVALNMRAKNVRLVAVDGPANTTIEGACDPGTGGCGANAVRCVLLYLKTGATEGFAAVQGFTLTDGYSLNANDGRYGAAIYGSGSDYCFVTDCRIYGNDGVCGACAGAFFERCEIFDNHTSAGLVAGKKDTVLSSCLIHNNRGVTTYEGALGMNVTAVNCTVAERRATGHALGTGYALNAWNCVIAGGDSTGEKAVLDGCVLWDFDTYKSAIKGYRKLDPYWVNPHPDDRTTTDLRSFLISDVFTAGTLPTAENAGADLYQYVGADFGGNRMTFGEASMPAGAYTAGVPYVLIVADKGGIGTNGKVGFNLLEGDATLDVYGSGVADRPCVGIFVGDELKLFDDLEGGDGIPPETVRITAAEAVAGLTVTAAYTNEWYVKPDGSDASSGFTPKHAKKTFAAVMECAQAGDTVRCGEGDYGDEVGSMTEGGNVARVVVKDGVTLAGAGIGKTIIRGKADDNGTNGCGPDALRCVILAGNAAKVKDLTMIDGHSDKVGTDKDDYKNYVANFGGGVFATRANDEATAENCLITNCVAIRGGGSYSVKLVNCRVMGNSARFTSNGAAALYYGSAYGTIFLNNVGPTYTVMYPTVLENCTIAGENATNKTGYDFFISSSGTCTLKNTLIAGSSTLNNTTKACTISHCAFASDAYSVISADKTDGTCVYAPLADFTFDAEGRPIVGANPAIDKGDLTQFRESVCGAFDASGFQRVMNGTMDIGALEADWRGRYRKDLKVHLGEVRTATPGIVENAQGKVVLSDGDALDLSWSHRCAGTSQLNVTIAGEGTLTIRKGDETLATVTETTSIDYPVSPDVTDELTFAFAGAGSASFDVSDAHLGVLLMVR